MPASLAEFLDQLTLASADMRRAGARRLLVLSGEAQWLQALAMSIRLRLPGDWPWVGEGDDLPSPHCRASAVRGLLGREFLHGVFDARQGLAADALAALAGTLTAGSWLILLVPEWRHWPSDADSDSLRWSEGEAAIPTPHFIDHLRRTITADAETVLVRQHHPAAIPPLRPRPCWAPPVSGPTIAQKALLHYLLGAGEGVYVLTAPRGRGKSALAGMLAARAGGSCWITAPAKIASGVLAEYAGLRPGNTGEHIAFFAPDALLDHCRRHPPAQWLLVDEAAAIPLPLLRQLIAFFPRVLLTTTVQGYEGSGRGFLLKFCAGLPRWQSLSLDCPLRWAPNDPLERWIADALLLDDSVDPLAHRLSGGGYLPELIGPIDPKISAPALRAAEDAVSAPLHIERLSRRRWRRYPNELAGFYQLLASAHYRTTPLDLRRLMDAPGQHLFAALAGDETRGALWLVEEGGLDRGLAHEVWAGRRRPPGNLVAQSLAAHGGLWTAPLLRSMRISRIAVAASQRRRGLGRSLVKQALLEGKPLDYLSVSFGFTEELWHFWRQLGFQLVHMGSHLEPSSGCYSAMALLPLSSAGQRLTEQGLSRYAWDRAEANTRRVNGINQEDWRSLAGFAFAQRPPEASQPSLARLLAATSLALPALRAWVELRQEMAQMVSNAGVSGKKALITRWRQETAAGLWSLDKQACARWQAWCAPEGYRQDEPG